MTISNELPAIRQPRPKQSAEHEVMISKQRQPLMSRDKAMVYRFMGITAWILQTFYWLYDFFFVDAIDGDSWHPLEQLFIGTIFSVIVALHFRDAPIATRARLCVHATLFYFAFNVTGGCLWAMSLLCAKARESRDSIMVWLVSVYWWFIITAIIWGFLVSIGPQDESDIRLPYWFKEFLPYALAKHIIERDSSKERSCIDKKEQ
ncbi:hypothetical protein GCG54_00007442 [Colletotrichum gloeosporioides]|uniref:Uncharacterized protein n=1 Tax=Colletotrichum gloeosporioides TaxID=474922 RepID=A0A8H4FNT9_COLGL|nr:uncharacterized protein GCG54_00007442 [Colletotrichum gloeosporioides]KAF3807709.1 hypothetical protein GCG54_00007442 [Colletotrichum gloeosporioides]